MHRLSRLQRLKYSNFFELWQAVTSSSLQLIPIVQSIQTLGLHHAGIKVLYPIFIRHSRAFAPKPTRKLSTLHVFPRVDSPNVHHHFNQQRTHYITQSSATTHIHNVRSNPPHHRSLPRAILPPDRPHPRQSTPDPWRASDNRCRWAGQCLLEPRKSDEPTVRKRMDS